MADEPADILDREVRRALQLNPNLAQAHTILGALVGSLGVSESYVGQAEEAYRLDPLSPATIRFLGNAYFFSGKREEAKTRWTKALEQAPIYAHRGLAEYEMLRGDFDQAEGHVRELERLAPSIDFALLARGYLAALLGDRTTAMQMIEKLETTFRGGYSRQSSVGFIYFALGDLDRFFEVMFAVAKHHTLQMARVRLSPMYATARRDPRFIELLSIYGRPVQWPH